MLHRSHMVAHFRDGTFTASDQVMVQGMNLAAVPTDAGFIQRLNGFLMYVNR